MNISKKLFLMAAIGLSLQANVFAADSYIDQEAINKQRIFDFAVDLQKQTDYADATIARQWLENELLTKNSGWCNGHYNYNYYNIDKIMLILDAQLTREEKIAYILQLKTNQDEEIAANIAANKKADEERKQKEAQAQKVFEKNQHIKHLKEVFTFGAVMTVAVAVLPALAIVSESVGHAIGPKIVKAMFGA